MRLRIDTGIHINLYRLLPLALILWPAGNAAADRIITHYSPRAEMTTSHKTYLSEGDIIAGYEVSSDYDLARVHPVKGVVEPHYGIDLATPTGTKIMAPENVSVVCWFDSNGGGEVGTVKMSDGSTIKLLHLSSCLSGDFEQGATFARTGSSGIGTGAHLDVRRADKAEPTREDIEPLLTGKPMRTVLSDRDLTCSIGAAEGTRDRNCNPTVAYSGHTDPGNGADNLGSFSYQHGADSPADADRRQLVRLRQAESDLQQRSQQRWGQPLSKPALGAALDLWNQAPLAGESFVDELPSPNPTSEQIVAARSRSYIDPATGKLDAPGLGNDPVKVEADQERRTDEVLNQLQQRRIESLDK
ncbi:MAG: M23 family metallopeptidase [Phormidesmis sp.]